MAEPRECVKCGEVKLIKCRNLCNRCYCYEKYHGRLYDYPKYNKKFEKRYDHCIDCNQYVHIYGRDRCRLCYNKWYRSQPGWKEHHAAQMRRERKEKPELYKAIEKRRAKTEKRKQWKEKYQPEYYRKNAEKLRQAEVERRKQKPELMAKYMRDAYQRRNEAEGHYTDDQWQALVEYYCPDNRCLCCGDEYDNTILDRKLTVDHIVPLSNGGTHWPDNIQPLCYRCNCSKQDHHDTDYRPDSGEFARSLMSESIDDS